jgi:hypothetical protein
LNSSGYYTLKPENLEMSLQSINAQKCGKGMANIENKPGGGRN